MYYSLATQSFYGDDVPPSSLPEDAQVLTPEQRAALLRDQAVVAELPHEVLVDCALRTARAERAPILVILDGLQSTACAKGLAALLSGDQATAALWSDKASVLETLKQALKDATAVVDLAPLTTFEEMRLAFKAHYATLVAAAPAEIKLAFKEIAG